ncbi:DUF5333 domain-containing protein [Aquicoccus sp. G2-2]|uniref:DUF5333 domain-containing protein n=1 Tax=Aquicoccus sp. G2-2 TaxID=3092120 RepID=UPI002AE020EC|nr:DUF5333 domain-containing protein [Aquicoccus sp. G2-2]MEA1113292.1 DUF5333 domain-containing protein [Aquicoccus sp. G2-2]
MRKTPTALMGLALATALATGANAKTPLRDVPAIDDNMLWVALAIEISDKCAVIDARTFRGLAYLNSLKNKAQDLGYSNDEIRSYVKSDTEKARMRKRGEKFMRTKGLNPESDADLCALGKAEIARGSVIGSLLKAR